VTTATAPFESSVCSRHYAEKTKLEIALSFKDLARIK
jgi:hypothetical protein